MSSSTLPANVIAANPFFADKAAAPQAAPAGFREHTVRREYLMDKSADAVWAWLNNPDTFTKGQIPPWRVEFVSARSGHAGRFS